ncbi:MAG: ATP-binding protein [Clostridia bacterium]|nr:ATP-binding protein [Clostridia bacterium]
MRRIAGFFRKKLEDFLNMLGLDMRTKLVLIFLVVKVIPLLVLTLLAWRQINLLGGDLREIAVSDSSAALNANAVENIERMTTDTANAVASFLYARDNDIRYLASIEPSEENYRNFLQNKTGRLVEQGEWALAEDGLSWVTNRAEPQAGGDVSTNPENNDMDGFHYRHPDTLRYQNVPLYDEIAFVDLAGNEVIKVIAENSTKTRYPMTAKKQNVAQRENTYVKSETYFAKLKDLQPGDIFVSDVIGAYTPSNYIGMYVPQVVAAAADRGYDIPYEPEAQAFAGQENPHGQRFEGIVRWATPVADENDGIIGYVTFALNHDHIMAFVDHITPTNERYTELPSAFEGNYAFIWDYQCRSICHPRHHSIYGFDPNTGDPQIPWLETSIHDAWHAWQEENGPIQWMDFVEMTNWPLFDEQSRDKRPAPELTRLGLVGLDGRYLNNAPQCTGWMDLTVDGGSGSFYILWSGLYKLTTAAAIPYYTGPYEPSIENGFSKRGFGIVTIGASLEDFARPATETEERFTMAINTNLRSTFAQLFISVAIIIVFVVLIAMWIASFLTVNITRLISGISRFRNGARQFRFQWRIKNEFGTLADSFDDMAQSIVDSEKNALSIIDAEHRIIYMNDVGLKLCGKTLNQAVGLPYSQTSVYPTGTVYDPLRALRLGQEAEILYIKDKERYVHGTASHFFNKSGQKIGYIIQSVDVTDMVLKQQKIEEQRTLLDKIFSASPDLVWYMDGQGRYLTVNPRFSAIVGQEPEAFTGKTAMEALPAGIAQALSQNDQEAMQTGHPLYSEETLSFADGHQEVLDSVRTPIWDASGALVGLLGFARNVDARVTIEAELRNTQMELERAVNDANRANEHKGDFLARMSHEIRTPMNAIIGITGILQKKLLAFRSGHKLESNELAEVALHMNQIETSSQHLLGLLNDILDISKIEAGKIELSEEAVDLVKLANTVVGIITPRCDEKGISFLTCFDSFSPTAFVCDPLRLRQVLINLLGNAVKFTPENGAVEFHVKKKDQRPGETLVEFIVGDNGVGISKEAQADIFEPFEQGGAKVSRKYGGSGLGLAISRNIVRLFGGEIVLESQEGKGSEFRFSIWMRESETEVPPEEIVVELTDEFVGKRVLLVDDVEINRIIVAAMLENTGILIDDAADGIAALKAFETSPTGTYDAILMDVQMPNMNGYEASMAIREMSAKRPDASTVPIIALTANAFKEDIDEALRSGMNAHIAKPVEQEKLVEMLLRFLVKK